MNKKYIHIYLVSVAITQSYWCALKEKGPTKRSRTLNIVYCTLSRYSMRMIVVSSDCWQVIIKLLVKLLVNTEIHVWFPIITRKCNYFLLYNFTFFLSGNINAPFSAIDEHSWRSSFSRPARVVWHENSKKNLWKFFFKRNGFIIYDMCDSILDIRKRHAFGRITFKNTISN